MSDTQNDGEIIAHLPGGIEVRTAHGADGKFTSGSGGNMVHSPLQAKIHSKIAQNFKKSGHHESAAAHEASARAWNSGKKEDHETALAAHLHAASTSKFKDASVHHKGKHSWDHKNALEHY